MRCLLTILILSFLTFPAYAELKTYGEDLNNDGTSELISVHQEYEEMDSAIPYASEMIITVVDRTIDKSFSFSMPDHLGSVEFISLNKDGFKQIVAWSHGGNHYTNISVYGYKNNKLYKIFENGSACVIKTDFQATPPTIKVGRANWEKEGWCYADEPLWQIYNWNGEEFVYNKERSSFAEISQIEEVQRFIKKIKEEQ